MAKKDLTGQRFGRLDDAREARKRAEEQYFSPVIAAYEQEKNSGKK